MLYTGNGGNKTISGYDFQPDLVWGKARNQAYNHHIHDAVRGVEKRLAVNTTDQEYSDGALKTFTSDGYTFDTAGAINVNGTSYVNWSWKANGSGSSNTDGDIDSTISANTDAKFSIVSYTGVGGEPKTVAHGLGVSPEMVIIKKRNNSGSWVVWHKDLADNYAFEGLDTTGAAVDGGSPISKYVDAVSSTLVTLGDASENNNSGDTFIMYCWASVDGYSKVGSFEGNASADGTFIYTGFRPAFVMIKAIDETGHWYMYDSARNTYNVVGEYLTANNNDAGSDDTNLDFVSNGFKMRTTFNRLNDDTLIYLAFAETPFKYSNAR